MRGLALDNQGLFLGLIYIGNIKRALCTKRDMAQFFNKNIKIRHSLEKPALECLNQGRESVSIKHFFN